MMRVGRYLVAPSFDVAWQLNIGIADELNVCESILGCVYAGKAVGPGEIQITF